MLTKEENEFLCRIGPDTPMGNLMRCYWHPFLLTRELPDADGPAIRVRLLGEDLVAFRNTEGQVGLIAGACPHRGASMFFGINQESGLMCIYHGWKYDVDGNCVDMPSDLPGSTFKDKVRTTSYPCWENNGIIWTYMGDPAQQPAYPDFIFNRLPPTNVNASRVPIYCNYLQSLEGNIDSTHLGTLHANYENWVPVVDGTDKPGYPSFPFGSYLMAGIRYATVDVQDTDYGFRLIAIRTTAEGNQYVRINSHILPYSTFVATPGPDGAVLIHVPVDDENCFRVTVGYRTSRPFTQMERDMAKATDEPMDPNNPKIRMNRADNDYHIDRKAQKTTTVSGIWPLADQDYAVTEGMGTILDRTREHLYSGDAGVIRVRQMLGQAARNLEEGICPPGIGSNILFHKITSEAIIIGPDDDPWMVAADAGETAKRGERLV